MIPDPQWVIDLRQPEQFDPEPIPFEVEEIKDPEPVDPYASYYNKIAPAKPLREIFTAQDKFLGEDGTASVRVGDFGRMFYTEQVHDITPETLKIKKHLTTKNGYEQNARGEVDDGSDAGKFRFMGATGSLWDGPSYGNTWVTCAIDGEFLPGDRIVTFIGNNSSYRVISQNNYFFQYATYTVKEGLSNGFADEDPNAIEYNGVFQYRGDVVPSDDDTFGANLLELLASGIKLDEI